MSTDDESRRHVEEFLSNPLDRAFLSHPETAGTLVLVRHGQQQRLGSSYPLAERIDPPLTDLGERQIRAVAAHLSSEPVDVVYSSTMRRAVATAEVIAAAHDIGSTRVHDLREIGVLRDIPEGASLTEALEAVVRRGAAERFVNERRWEVYPMSETGPELRTRVTRAIEGILASHAGETVVVACHGGVINAYLAHMLGVDEDMFFRPEHCSVHRIAFEGHRRVIRSLSEIHHLRDDGGDLVTV
ncbi:MAG: histidine phosphatase family protein [Acidimicrobiales bacterium]